MNDPFPLSSALLLDLFDEPISFRRAYVELTGSVTAALYLSVACELSAALPDDSDGWLHLSIEQWCKETMLTRAQLASARKVLTDINVLWERRVGAPPRLETKVNAEVLMILLDSQAKRRYDPIPYHPDHGYMRPEEIEAIEALERGRSLPLF